MSEVKWTVGRVGEPTEKIEYIQMTRSTSDNDKESVRMWNLMRKTLLDNGLMKDKDEN